MYLEQHGHTSHSRNTSQETKETVYVGQGYCADKRDRLKGVGVGGVEGRVRVGREKSGWQ